MEVFEPDLDPKCFPILLKLDFLLTWCQHYLEYVEDLILYLLLFYLIENDKIFQKKIIFALLDNFQPQFWPKSRAYSRKQEQHPIFVKTNAFFLKKGTKNFTIPYSNPFVSAKQNNKALHNFCKLPQN